MTIGNDSSFHDGRTIPVSSAIILGVHKQWNRMVERIFFEVSISFLHPKRDIQIPRSAFTLNTLYRNKTELVYKLNKVNYTHNCSLI